MYILPSTDIQAYTQANTDTYTSIESMIRQTYIYTLTYTHIGR